MKKMLKSIITAMLCMAIALTGISFSDTVTANAVTTKDSLDKFVNGGTVTMKPGEKKKILVLDKDGNDISWRQHGTSSDESIVEIESDFVDTRVDLTECLVLIAKNTGTATVTFLGAKMTVIVEKPAATAKQQKCKHVFKVTRKATCERLGQKTCKICKYQKEIAQLAHKYVKTTVHNAMEYDGWYTVGLCNGCDCKDPLNDHPSVWNGRRYVEGACPTKECTFETRVKFDANGNVTPDSEYKSLGESDTAMFTHYLETRGNHYSYASWEEYYGVRRVTKTISACKWCGIEKK